MNDKKSQFSVMNDKIGYNIVNDKQLCSLSQTVFLLMTDIKTYLAFNFFFRVKLQM